jgi:hypothetical protein
MYKTILGQGHGTQHAGSLAKNTDLIGGSQSIGGAPRLSMGMNATSGIIIEKEKRSKTIDRGSLERHTKFTHNVYPYGHQKSTVVPQILKSPNDELIISAI